MQQQHEFHQRKDIKEFISWRKDGLIEGNGIIAASDDNLEWLLPWWWKHLSQHSRLPVTFVDYGMSKKAHRWCKERGEVLRLSLPESIFSRRTLMPAKYEQDTPVSLASIRRLIRSAWFKKPFAMVLTPYKRTLWLDIDCEVRGDLSPIFPFAENPTGIALALSPNEAVAIKINQGILKPGYKGYNTGVIPYKRGAKLIEEWACKIVLGEGIVYGEQDVLSQLINEDYLAVPVLPNKYNWRIERFGPNELAVVLHWAGGIKKTILKQVQSDPGLQIRDSAL